MKKIFLLVAIIATALVQNSFAQDNSKTQLLHSYLDIKNALVAGNASLASEKAGEFVKALNSADIKTLSADSRDALLKDADHISKTKEIKHQREHFEKFSLNMYTLAKAEKLTDKPVYYAYCPMKKAHWLSSEPAIKNPYFGSAMLTCGKVEETLK
ncbi:MAG: DUF3347 domain-containing protein [Bacteroidota bacterium]|nr:DUF3347 domain-containing protein [Bacteroidota bacterium]